MRIFKNKLLLIVLILAASLRLWNLGGNPPHLTPDEASLGYNAYSIMKTGRDEHGELLPLIFKSFGDYKPGLYIYAAVPSVAIFGLTEFATRLPSALAGIAAVLLLYKILEELLPKEKRLPIVSALVLAISPWHIHFSRGAWEINLSLTLTLLGVYLFLKSLRDQKWLVFSAFSFALTLIAYQGAKLSSGIVVLLLLILYWKKIFSFNKKTLIFSGVVGVLVSLPIILSLFTGRAGRLNVFSVFSYPRPREYTESFLEESGVAFGSPGYYAFYSETLNFTRGVLGRWFNHFSGRFLFFEGDWQNPRHSSPYHGMLLLGDMLFLALGLFALARGRLGKEELFILLWLILSPLPSALSRDQVHAVRSFNLAIPLAVITAFGVLEALKYLEGRKGIIRKVSYLVIGIIYVGGLARYLDAYFVHLPLQDSKLWEYGYKQVVEMVTPIQANYEKVKVRQSFAQPYIYFLVFQKYDPAKYQAQSSFVDSEYKGDVGYVERLDNIYFAPIDWSVSRGEHGTLFVADPVRIPPQDSSSEVEFDVIGEINYLNNLETAFRVVAVK